MKNTIEKKVSGTILQENFIVLIGGVKYEVAPPSTAVLIKISEIISEFTGKKLDDNDVLGEVLRNAKDCKFIGKMIAQMIIGIKKPKKRFSIIRESDKIKALSETILLAPPSDLKTAISILFKHHEVGDFFGLTAFLLEVGITKETREAETIAYGQ